MELLYILTWVCNLVNGTMYLVFYATGTYHTYVTTFETLDGPEYFDGHKQVSPGNYERTGLFSAKYWKWYWNQCVVHEFLRRGSTYLVVVGVLDSIVWGGLGEFDSILLAVGVVEGATIFIEVASLLIVKC